MRSSDGSVSSLVDDVVGTPFLGVALCVSDAHARLFLPRGRGARWHVCFSRARASAVVGVAGGTVAGVANKIDRLVGDANNALANSAEVVTRGDAGTSWIGMPNR